ncbi:hypothetical protein BGZ76_007160 [Entomortierella beljakovae]|nr:hypothetical protein BGZ76_007160 [Entomortierella beljakovae]
MYFKRSITSLALCLITLATLAAVSQAHVGLLRPCARGSPRAGCPAPSNGQNTDYDLNSPIGTRDSKNAPLCKQTIASSQRTSVKAGSSITTTYSVGAAHGGGHCQWAISYDNKNWVVLKTLVRDCLRDVSGGGSYSVSVPIPKNAPAGKATFMWLWNNAIGNRELYSNCADIQITGGPNGGKLTGPAPLIANYGAGSVSIGEFGNGQNDGSANFAKRKTITITVPKK